MKDKIQHTIDHFRKMNLLGKDICGILSTFDIVRHIANGK